MSVGTFHGLCMKLLRDRLGDVTLIDETAALALVEELCAELGLKKKGPATRWRLFRREKNRLTAGKEADEAEQTLFAYYCERLEEYGALDYDDLILQTLALFEQSARSPDRSANRSGGCWSTSSRTSTPCSTGWCAHGTGTGTSCL